jgi:hypothetical protein
MTQIRQTDFSSNHNLSHLIPNSDEGFRFVMLSVGRSRSEASLILMR